MFRTQAAFVSNRVPIRTRITPIAKLGAYLRPIHHPRVGDYNILASPGNQLFLWNRIQCVLIRDLPVRACEEHA